MAVYVDPLFDYEGKGSFCHLIATSEDELHLFADEIGMPRIWFQPHPPSSIPHYDLGPFMRRQAVLSGAVALDRKAFLKKVRELRDGW